MDRFEFDNLRKDFHSLREKYERHTVRIDCLQNELLRAQEYISALQRDFYRGNLPVNFQKTEKDILIENLIRSGVITLKEALVLSE